MLLAPQAPPPYSASTCDAHSEDDGRGSEECASPFGSTLHLEAASIFGNIFLSSPAHSYLMWQTSRALDIGNV
jgi:hypothetical protein